MKFSITLTILLLVAPAAMAQSASERPAYASEPVRASLDDQQATRKAPRCLGVTATRIRRPSDPCQSPGRRFDADDISRTGEVDLGEALRKLDPSVTGGRR
jgi:hypothetical protein